MKTLLNEQQLQAGVDAMAAQISAKYENRQLTIVAVMTGSLVHGRLDSQIDDAGASQSDSSEQLLTESPRRARA